MGFDLSEKLPFIVDILKTTPKAALVKFDGDEIWLPFSVCDIPGEAGDTDVEIEVPEWLAHEKGLV